jgi:Tol biopolymer transport system component
VAARWPAFATAISADGMVVAFVEVQTGPGPAPYFAHYVRDRAHGVTLPVGPRVPGYLGISPTAALSGDGRYVTASTVPAGGVPQLAVYDRQLARYTTVSVDAAGGPANDICTDPALTADGSVVAFSSDATDLVADDRNRVADIFVRDLGAGSTRRASVDSGGQPANGSSATPSTSADGRYVVFASDATNLVAGDTNGAQDVFVRDLTAGSTRRVSLDSRGHQGDGDSTGPSISADGRYVTFASAATNLAAGDTNDALDVFVRDLRHGTTNRVSLDSRGRPGDAPSYDASISPNGRYVAFASDATNLVAGDTNELPDVFLRDLRYGSTQRASLTSDGQQGDGLAGRPALSGNGRYLAFAADSTDLVPGQVPDTLDVFVRDRWSHTNFWVNQPAGS